MNKLQKVIKLMNAMELSEIYNSHYLLRDATRLFRADWEEDRHRGRENYKVKEIKGHQHRGLPEILEHLEQRYARECHQKRKQAAKAQDLRNLYNQ